MLLLYCNLCHASLTYAIFLVKKKKEFDMAQLC